MLDDTVIGSIFYIKDHYLDGTDLRTSFEPFFKTDYSDLDYIPPLLKLTDFGRGVSRVSGDLKTRPNEEDFRILLDFP